MRIKQFIYSLIFMLMVLLPLLKPVQANAQQAGQEGQNKNLVQITGLITAADSKLPIPFATVRIKSSTRGTIAGVDGFYSVVAGEKDTLEYVAMGYKTIRFMVPPNTQDNKITHSVELPGDTLTFDVTDIYPWPTKEEFRQAFLNLKLDDDPYDAARKNLDQQKLMELYETLARDGKEGQIYQLQQIAQSYYYAGGQRNYMMMGPGGGSAIPTSLLNPLAWTQFIQAIREGKFKQKK